MTRVTLLALLLILAWPALLRAADPVELEVTGIGGDALKNVRQALALPYGMVREHTVNRLWLDRFAVESAGKVKTALEPFGYYHPRIVTSIEEPARGRFVLRVAVDPGPPVLVEAVDIALTGAGAGERGLKELVAAFPLRRGSLLLQQEYEAAKARLKARAQELGYLDADFTRHALRIAPGERSARIEITLETGDRYFFGAVRFEGATGYPDPYLRRFIAFKAGDVFSYGKLGETQLNLANSERFREILVTPEKEAAQDHRVPVLVKVRPVPRRTIRPGVGFGTDTGPRFTVRFRDLNLFHAGNDLDVTLYAAQLLQGLASRYTIPSSRDLKSSTSVQLNLQQEDITAYTSRLVAVELDRNRSFGRGELGTVYLRVQQENFTIGNQNSGSRLVLPGIRFSTDHFDNLIRPTRGYRFALDLRGTHTFLGSTVGLAQAIAETNLMLPLPWRLSLHMRGKAAGTLLADPLSDVPPSIRFFAGGDQSVRGYSYQSLGPRDATGQVVGGRDLLVGSIELERALFEKWGVSAFFDVGNAYNDLSTMTLAQGAGVGVHYYTPVGGINLYLARRINEPTGHYYIHLTVGFQL
ncbi:autotransporter assembly complex protein TamA [Geomesophilobacter sediminis]|uniref:Translocation and assembly module subunit TamA n=1 Tax=Geomesophilobacter sediminis TaxID=2798584 RepID=A0A8J7SBC3_9BACT|nr:autotransporter assembly complex family protein [Geomesophilobacter sediminis]MBJ6728005.1 outer membrane protein assembly factor [Geomesophilobacter sediminis]